MLTVGKTYYVDKTPSEVEELMELPFFSPLGRIPLNMPEYFYLWVLPGSTQITNPFRLFKDPSSCHASKGSRGKK